MLMIPLNTPIEMIAINMRKAIGQVNCVLGRSQPIQPRNTLTTGKRVLIEEVLEPDGYDAGLSPPTEWKTHMSDKEQAPMVTFNRIDKSAYFSFNGRRYELQGKYNSLDDARQVAEKQCRAMGWNG